MPFPAILLLKSTSPSFKNTSDQHSPLTLSLKTPSCLSNANEIIYEYLGLENITLVNIIFDAITSNLSYSARRPSANGLVYEQSSTDHLLNVEDAVRVTQMNL